jgi:hypothetical protein
VKVEGRSRHQLSFRGAKNPGLGRCFVSVELGNERRALDVFATIDEFLRARTPDTAVSMTVSVDGHDYGLQGWATLRRVAPTGAEGLEPPPVKVAVRPWVDVLRWDHRKRQRRD